MSTQLNKQKIIKQLKNASNSGSLLTPKHDPNSGQIFKKFRTVLTQEASGSLQALINSEEYELEAYYNKKHKGFSYKMIPFDSGSYTTVGLGILPDSSTTSGTFDTFLIVSGSSDGWHIYSEDSAKMQSQLDNNEIEYKGKL